MTEFLFPDVGEGIHEGKLIAWHVKEGDTVKNEQVLCEVETDKAVVEIPSPRSGIITKLHAAAGATIMVGSVLVTFADGASTEKPVDIAAEFKRPIESGTSRVESTLVPTPPHPHEHEPIISTVADTRNQQGPAVSSPTSAASQASPLILAAPSTRKLAREKNIDLKSLHGSGPNGRILVSDVLAAAGGTPLASKASTATNVPPAQAAPIAASAPPAGSVTTTPYEGRRKAIGEHLVEAQRVPAVTLFARADASEIVSMRERFKENAQARGIKLTYLALFAKAAVAALKLHPAVNSALTTRGIEAAGSVHLGVAVDNPKGLLVPVVRDAQTRSVLSLAAEVQRLADLAKADKLTASDMHGSTFSITSIGPLRVEGFTPMLNTPDSAILGIGAILDEPWVVNGAVVARKVVTFSLTFDHRVYDGAEAARFLTDVVRFTEDPQLLIMEGQ